MAWQGVVSTPKNAGFLDAILFFFFLSTQYVKQGERTF